MNRQEIFNKAFLGILRQGGRSLLPELNKGCAYRNGEKKCAIGHNILDHEYHPNMEKKGAATLLQEFPYLSAFHGVNPRDHTYHSDMEFLRELQMLHDDTDTLSFADGKTTLDDSGYLIRFKVAAVRFAAKWKVQIPSLIG